LKSLLQFITAHDRWILGAIGAVLVSAVLRSLRALWATFTLAAAVIALGILGNEPGVPILVRAILAFVLGGVAFWIIDWADNKFVGLVIGAAGVAALVYFS
jgi:hypothetical protein